jgi:hypothetical protein
VALIPCVILLCVCVWANKCQLWWAVLLLVTLISLQQTVAMTPPVQISLVTSVVNTTSGMVPALQAAANFTADPVNRVGQGCL